MDTRFLFENVLENVTLTATDTATGYNVNNILDRRNYTKWRANTYGTKYITTADYGSLNSIANTVAIFGHNFYSVGATVTLEKYVSLVGDWQEVYFFPITKDGAIAGKFTTISDANQWRLKIVTTSGNIPEFSCMLLGQAAVFPFPPDSPHSDFVQTGLNESAVSKTGNLLGVVNRGYETTFSLKFSFLSRTWVDAWLLNWWYPYYGRVGKPFIYIPDLDFDDEEVYLVKCADNYQFQLPKSLLSYYDSVQFDLQGIRL